MSSRISHRQLIAFGEELEKIGSKWYSGAAGAVKRFGQRQAHSLTGWTPNGFSVGQGKAISGIEEMGAGAARARKEFNELPIGAAKNRAAQALVANEKAQAMGLTSLPGYVNALRNHKVKDVARTALHQQLHGTTGMEKAITLGLPALGLASEAASADDGHKGERLGGEIASTAAGMFTGGLPLAGGMVAGLGAGFVGGRAGRAIDKLRGTKPTVQAPPNPEEARGQHVPTERIMSPAASGQTPESIG